MSDQRPMLLYFADAMCSWCYGFEPEMRKVLSSAAADHDLLILSGGLRPYNREPMTEKAKDQTREHWRHVEAASGQPFDFGFFGRESFVYDTEPASRAVVTVRSMQPTLAYAYMAGIQHAFYARNIDITQPSILADAAVEFGLDREAFTSAFASPEMQEETKNDFRLAARLGIDGFPTLLRAQGEHLRLISRGYADAGTVLAAIEQAKAA